MTFGSGPQASKGYLFVYQNAAISKRGTFYRFTPRYIHTVNSKWLTTGGPGQYVNRCPGFTQRFVIC